MLQDLFETAKSKMQEYQDATSKAESIEAQKKTDQSYCVWTNNLHNEITAVDAARRYVGFQPKSETIGKLESCQQIARDDICGGNATTQNNDRLKNSVLDAERAIKADWKVFYKVKTESSLSLLELISKISPNEAKYYSSKINEAKEWRPNEKIIKDLNNALSTSGTLTNKLHLDDKVQTFLKKLNSGQATILDLNDDVNKWIRDEGLSGRIVLSLSGKPVR